MTTYIDSSVLVSVYVPERFSNAARRTVRAVPQVPFTQLHDLEVASAFELLVGRGDQQGKSGGINCTCKKTCTVGSSHECLWIWTACSRAQVISHARTRPGASLEAWTCCRSCRPSDDVFDVCVGRRSPARSC